MEKSGDWEADGEVATEDASEIVNWPSYTAILRSPLQEGEVYRAITEQMPDWWTKMDKPFLAVGDRAKTGFGGRSYWVFEAKTLRFPALIELECCESNMDSPDLDDPEEWLGTTLRFEIGREGSETIVRFTHIGLTRNLECFEICEAGWDHFLLGSLNDFLNGGSGQPNSF